MLHRVFDMFQEHRIIIQVIIMVVILSIAKTAASTRILTMDWSSKRILLSRASGTVLVLIIKISIP